MYDLYKTPGVPGDPWHFSKVVKAPECLSSWKMFLNDFYKTLGVPETPKHFSEVAKAPECLSSM